MNEEEYLYSYLNDLISYPFTRDSRNHIMELFNNLQEENERLKEQYKNSQITLAEEWKKRLEVEEKNKHLDNQITMLKQQNNTITEMGLDYKSRCEKAIELLRREYWIKEHEHNDDVIDMALNILQGSDKE